MSGHSWPTYDEISEAIKAEIASAGLSQREVAEMSGIPLATLDRRLNSGSPLLYPELRAIAHVLGRPASELLVGVEAGRSGS